MIIVCPKCQSEQWHATGRFTKGRRGRDRAEVTCDQCRKVFTSGLQQALDAGAAERGDCEVADQPPAAVVPVPQPSLPIPGTTVSRHAGFASTGELARRAIADYERRWAGKQAS